MGVTFGVLADAAGLSLAQVVVMSALVFTGASQFAAVSVVDTGGSGVAAVGLALLLAARNALYGPVVARILPAAWIPRASSAQFVIDETTAMASVQETDVDARGASGGRRSGCGPYGTSDRSAVRFSARSSERRRRGVLMQRSRPPSLRCLRRMSENGRARSPPWSELRLRLRSRRSHPPVSRSRGGTRRDPGLAGRARGSGRMSWPAPIVLVVGAYGLKAFGVLRAWAAGLDLGARLEPLTSLIPAALFAGLIAVQTVGGDETLVLDARVWGVAAGSVAVWRKAPFVVVVLIAMAVTAFVRWQT